MKPRKYIFFFASFLITGSSVCAQDFTELEGRVYSKDGDVAGTHVVNRTTQRATITDSNGFFTISVKLNDTLVFSAVQFKRKEIVVTASVLNTALISVPLEEVLTELEEVVITPYSLTGTLGTDLGSIKTDPIVTSSSLGLDNKKIQGKPKGVGKVFKVGKYARIVVGYDTLSLQPKIYPEIYMYQLWKQLSGTNRDLETYAALEEENDLLEDLKELFTIPVFVEDLKIPEERINDFMNYCAADTDFDALIATDNKIDLWHFIAAKSAAYRKDNNLE